MREIKFRAWDTQLKAMIGSDERDFAVSFDGFISVYNGEELCDELTTLELMQYTGLKDKNGKEIYEGDLIKYEAGAWVDCYGAWQEKSTIEKVEIEPLGTNPFSATGYDDITIFYPENGQVIGNIYENPELLEN